MAYSTARVTAYINTGFSATNTPANATVLQNSAVTVLDLGDINCLPLVGQSSGTIQVHDFNGLSQCDYMKIVFSDSPVTTYWLVTGYDYVAGDTVNVQLIMDGFLTCGGTSGSITSLSGYVKRHTVADDSYGKYVQHDDLLIPSQNLEFRKIEKYGLKDVNESFYTVVLSTINLLYLGALDASEMGLDYGDGTITGKVTVPNIPTIPDTWKTTIKYGNYEYDIPAGFCFDGSHHTIITGIQRARSLGIENGIIACYALPKSKFTCTIPQITIPIVGTVVTGLITEIAPNQNYSGRTVTGIEFEYAQTNNKRAIYGDYSTVKLCSIASGEQIEFDIADLYDSVNQPTKVVIKEVGDGRAHGKPIFYPESFMHHHQEIDSMYASVSGLEWNNVPLVYDYSSGEGIRRSRYFATTQLGAQNMLEEHQLANYMGAVNTMLGAVGEAQSGTSAYLGSWNKDALGKGIGAYTADPASLVARGTIGMLNSGMNQLGSWGQRNLAEEQFLRARRLEKKDLMIDTRCRAPEITFPVSQSVRDFVGNGYIICLSTPSDEDLERFDVILNQFGYMDAGTPLTLADLTAGKYYSYIEASNVSIQCNLPVSRVIKEACEAQITAGIRIWKQRPDFSLYSVSNRN